MQMKLRNIGKKIMSNTKLDSMRKKILTESKKHIVNQGWNENLFEIIKKNNKLIKDKIVVLFPEGYLSLLKFFLEEQNMKMTESAKKIDLKRLKTFKKIREIILLRLKKNNKDKDLIKRTFFTLLLPQHSKLATKSLYKTVDQMWFIAGDN